MTLLRTFRNKKLPIERIAAVTMWGDKYRLTTFLRDGPTGHETYSTEAELERELNYSWVEDSAMGDELERWTDTPEWERGLKVTRVLSCWNACSYYGRYDLGRELDSAYRESLETAVTLIPRIMAQLPKEKE